ncbi:hypothetical protein BGZ73_000017 [Actinomortierella ambigua]|nr:hypothetical protein BGZ73_000017 [Actinomortierella ambigua]
MSFTSTLTLNVKDPFTIEFLGSPSRVMHNVTGVVHLHVQRTVTLKSASVAFVGEDSEPLVKITCDLPEASGVFQPGTYDFPFTLGLPGMLMTTNRDKLQPVELFWGYTIQTHFSPAGLFTRRKVTKHPVTLVRKQIQPSDSTPVRFSAKRPDEFDVTVLVPKMVGTRDQRATLLVYMHPYLASHRVRSIQVKAIQIEKIDYTEQRRLKTYHANMGLEDSQSVSTYDPLTLGFSNRPYFPGAVQSTRLRDLSRVTTIENPDQQEFTAAWGREYAIEVEIDFLPDADMIPGEEGLFFKITHAFQMTVHFVDPAIRPMAVNAPFVVGDFLEILPDHLMYSADDDMEHHDMTGIDHTSSSGGAAAGTGTRTSATAPSSSALRRLPPPDYGDEDASSTLLDANTGRLARSLLAAHAYPEREPIVPDVADELPPPTYDDSEFFQARSTAVREKEPLPEDEGEESARDDREDRPTGEEE